MERFILFTVNGVAFGAIYASVALALVIIYRSTRILNFAQGAQAVASAYVGWKVTDMTGSFWLGLIAALRQRAAHRCADPAHRLPHRREHAAPQHGDHRRRTSDPHRGRARHAVLDRAHPHDRHGAERRQDALGGVPLVSRQDLFVVCSVLLVMAGLGYLMTKTPVGLRMRAAAFAPDTARLMGVKVPRMLTLGWALAGVAGAFAAMLVIPTQAELIPQSMDGVFVLGFTAAVVGGLDSPVGAVVGGLACGLVALLHERLRQRRSALSRGAGPAGRRTADQTGGAVQLRPGEESLMKGKSTPSWLRHLGFALLFAVVGLAAVFAVDDFTASQVGTLGAYICVAFGLTVLVGGNGQISLGHAALMAIGAYTMAKFLPSYADDFGMASIPMVLVGLLLATVVTTVVGIIIGLAAARLRGPYLAGATLALGVAVPGVTTYFHDAFNGEQGLPIPVPQMPAVLEDMQWGVDRLVALLTVLCAVVVLFLFANLKRSGVGRHLGAVRDNEIAAQLCGLSVPREQVRAFALSAAAAGLGGGCLGLVLQGANPHSFGLVLSLGILGAVVIGGLGSLRGAIWGSMIVVFLAKFLEDLEVNDNAPAAAYGLLLIVVMLAVPGGIQGLVAKLGGRLPRRSPQPQGGN